MKKRLFILTLISLFLTFEVSNSQSRMRQPNEPIELSSTSVNLTILTVNATSVSPGSAINLGTYTNSTVTLTTQVNSSPSPSDSYPGTIKIYYKRNASYPFIVANGGEGGNLLFLGGTSAGRNFTITLNSEQFDATGGFLYSEYETFSGTKYKSSNVSIIKNNVTNPPGNGGGPSNNTSMTIPWGAVPVLPWLGANDWIWVNSNTSQIFNYDGKTTRIYNGATIAQKSLSLPETSTSCPVTIHVNKPFPGATYLQIDNEIASDQYVTYGQVAQTIIGNSATCNYPTPGTPFTNYQWQKRKIVSSYSNPLCGSFNNYLNDCDWQDIPNQTSQNYSPPNATNEPMEYRRLVVENPSELVNIYRRAHSSNVVTIYPISSDNISNTICCDQQVYNNTSVNPIAGNPTSISNKFFIWQKQEGVNLIDNSPRWVNLPLTQLVNNMNYTPPQQFIGRPGSVMNLKYRRLTCSYTTNIFYISNEVTITYHNSSARMSQNKDSSERNNYEDLEINIFPNPTSSVLNIQSEYNISNLDLKILDISGRMIFTRKRDNQESLSFAIDTSELPTGIYTLILENDSNKIVKKFIKN